MIFHPSRLRRTTSRSAELDRRVAALVQNFPRLREIAGHPAAALFYSLIESARLCGLEPRAYLGEASRRAIRNPGTVTVPRDLKSPHSGWKPVLDGLGAKAPEWPSTYD